MLFFGNHAGNHVRSIFDAIIIIVWHETVHDFILMVVAFKGIIGI